MIIAIGGVGERYCAQEKAADKFFRDLTSKYACLRTIAHADC